MNHLSSLVVFTANILGIFTDPFEFDGDYGQNVNPIRQTIFKLVMSRDEEDKERGPVLSEVVPPELFASITKKLPEENFNEIGHFLNQYGNQRIFRFLRNNPPELLKLDKTLRDKAASEGKDFNLPILSSSAELKGKNAEELKKNLSDFVFTKENVALAKPVRLNVSEDYLKEFFGDNAQTHDLQAFTTPIGQLFFFWLHHSLNLHLIAQDPGLIDQINFVKAQFANTLGNPVKRAELFKEKLLQANAGVLFTQESDAYLSKALTENGSFLPIDKQNKGDGTFVFLRKELWDNPYEMISLEDYPGYQEGKVQLILASTKDTGEKFLLASGHGNSTKPEDGRLQITVIAQKFQQLKEQYPQLQLLIGIDANTKTAEDVRLLREHLDKLGLIATAVGPTTIKKRMVTAQHGKAGHYAIDEEDYIITLKVNKLTHQTVGFKTTRTDTKIPLPNLDNQSDHYPVGALLEQPQKSF